MPLALLAYCRPMKTLILPSLLAADMGHLADEARRAQDSGADALHLDIMDGHFVPNISMGPAVVEMARRAVTIPLNVHLMLSRPDHYLKTFIEAGSDTVLIHIEASCDVLEALQRIRELGAVPGITLNPGTTARMVFPVLSRVDEVLCMTVRPGYGGQAFMPEVLPTIRAIRDYATQAGQNDLTVMVDGGINLDTAAQCAREGANAFVAGTHLFGAGDMATAIARLRESAAPARP